MPRSTQGTKKASATGIAKSAAGQARAAAASSKTNTASSKAKKAKKTPRYGSTTSAGRRRFPRGD